MYIGKILLKILRAEMICWIENLCAIMGIDWGSIQCGVNAMGNAAGKGKSVCTPARRTYFACHRIDQYMHTSNQLQFFDHLQLYYL